MSVDDNTISTINKMLAEFDSGIFELDNFPQSNNTTSTTSTHSNDNNVLQQLEEMIIPFLNKLIEPNNINKNYIYWPNRKEKIEDHIAKILQLTRSQ